jgi:uncharacterized repeat protein (TIGR03803 family)
MDDLGRVPAHVSHFLLALAPRLSLPVAGEIAMLRQRYLARVQNRACRIVHIDNPSPWVHPSSFAQCFSTGENMRTANFAPERRPKWSGVGKRGGWRMGEVFLLCFATVIVSPAQTFKTLVAFDGTNGSLPVASLVQGTDGDLYGTTAEGGAGGGVGQGTVFKITPGGKLTTLHIFSGTDGAYPYAGTVQATNGEFYGTTILGGANDWGTIFTITPGGKLTTLYSFCTNCSDGNQPDAGLIQARDGDLYGTTENGGINGSGTVFKLTTAGALTTLYSFCAENECADGANPGAGLLQTPAGELYGTTAGGGINGFGTVFKMTPTGMLTTLHSFDRTDGEFPEAGLIQDTNGSFYGTTFGGGAYGDGTVFEVTAAGVLTTLYSFCAQSKCTDGANPTAGLILASDGNLYGTTSAAVIRGGQNGDGTVFKITPGGKLTTLHIFSGTDGAGPVGGLVQATNGNFYGTTPIEGAGADGTLFSLSVGLGPFVETQPTSGKVGAKVIILGTNLTSASGVTFNGTAAKFTVVSKSEIKTIVPEGATTGTVEVTTAKGMLKSNVVFRVTR